MTGSERTPLVDVEETIDPKSKENNTKMYLCCAVAYLGSFATGTMLGLSSPLLPDIEADKSKDAPHVDFMNASWVGSLLNVGGIVGGIVAGYIMQSIGRKITTTLSAIPYVAGLLLITFSTRLWMLYVGRVISGLSVGTSLLIIPVYIGEISTSKLRGMLGAANQLCISIGVLIIYELGIVLPWRWMTVAAMALPTLLFIFSFFIVETPRYLMLSGEMEKAMETLKWLRGPNANIQSEFKELEDNMNSDDKSASWVEIIKKRELRTPTLISLAVMYFQKFSGIPFVMFYSKPVFMTAGLKNGSTELNAALLSVAGFQVFFTALSSLIVDKTGRKVLLIISGAFMSLSLTSLGIYFYLIRGKASLNSIISATNLSTISPNITTSPTTTISNLSYMPIVSMVSFISAYSIGFGPIAWLLMGEIIPLRARGNSAGFSTSFNLFLVFLVTAVFSTMMKTLTPEGTFWLFAANNAFSVLFIAIVLPETKGKSLEEIEASFRS